MRAHIVGAGLSGLAAAVALAKRGIAVSLYEAAPRAGGRCRSYHDAHLDCFIDNGNHLLMSGNASAMTYVEMIGAKERLTGPSTAGYPFIDVATGAHWTLRPSRGRIPWWILDEHRRAPGTTPASYISAVRLLQAQPHETISDVISPGTAVYRNFWEPLVIAALNTAPSEAAAVLMRAVLMETFLKGADACRPLIARESLAAALIDPALAFVASAGACVRLGCRVHALTIAAGSVTQLETEDGAVAIEPGDPVIVAVPSWAAASLVPGLRVPPPGETIVNVHYRLPQPVDDVKIAGIVGGVAQWLFLRKNMASVTISAAGHIADEESDRIATRVWRNVALALGDAALPEPPARVIKERRATFAQTPSALALRPDTRTALANLLLAGDWTATGLPATIEGAVRSGFRAAEGAITMHARSKAA